MARLLTILSILVVVAVVWLYWFWCHGPSPPLGHEEWWGPMELQGVNDTRVRTFEVKFSEEMIADLKRRLRNSRAPPPPLEGVAFQYGFNSLHLKSWQEYWIQEYNFTERERFFNQFPQFMTNIQGLDLHFIWVRPDTQPGVKIVPILLLHGWPGSVREFYEIIPLLTLPKHGLMFEVIVPSLPGFGFSDAPVRRGLGGPQTAIMLKNLMQRLGHQKFYIQGGDWGGIIAADLATLYPEAVLGYHTNLPFVQHPCAVALTALSVIFPSWLVDPEVVDRTNRLQLYWRAGGYLTLQATKPDTISIALNESPLGLLVYILEKFTSGADPSLEERHDQGLLEKFTRDQLLDNVMTYWVGGGGTAARIYVEATRERMRSWRLLVKPTPVPTWVLQAKHEILYQTPAAIRFKFVNLLNTTVLHSGGHFIALEEPAALAEDVFAAVRAAGEFYERQKGL